MAAPVTLDLTKGEFTEFSGTSTEDISYAKTFWQSIQLQPPMESRLVSSDIKQRLKIAPSGTHSMSLAHMLPEQPKPLQDFMIRAKTLERLEEYRVLQKYSHARDQDIELLHKRREERTKKEEISNGKGIKKKERKEAFVKSEMSDDDSAVCHEDSSDVLKQIDEFERNKFGDEEPDSD